MRRCHAEERSAAHDLPQLGCERAQTADRIVDIRVVLVQQCDQFFEFRITDNNLRVAGAADHSRVAGLKRNGFDAFVHFRSIATGFFVRPIGQAVKTVGKSAMRVFHYSIVYLPLLFIAIIADKLL